TIPPGSAAGVYSNTRDVIRVEEADQIIFRAVSVSSGTSAVISSVNARWSSDNSVGLIGNARQNSFQAASNTSFYSLFNDVLNPAEIGIQIPWPIGGTFSKLYFRSQTTQSINGTFDVTLRVNGVDSALTLSVPTAALLGIFSDPTNSVVVVAGDLINLVGINNGSANSCKWVNTMMRFSHASNSSVIGGNIGARVTAGNTFWAAPFGKIEITTATEADLAVPRDGILKNLHLRITAVGLTGGGLVFTLQVDGVDTPLEIIVPDSQGAGNVADTTHEVTVTKGQRIRIKVANDGGGGSSNNMAGWAMELAVPA
ncbi:MAG: hypothetical protein J3T61_12550, partial [Candidatus Brocadiales bacterium]|nr:hypothetical protein [Candidatus Bathyanammoxibius sp.]